MERTTRLHCEEKKNTEAGESETNIGKGDMYKKIEKLRNRRKVDSRKKQNILNKKNLKIVRKNNKRQQKERWRKADKKEGKQTVAEDKNRP